MNALSGIGLARQLAALGILPQAALMHARHITIELPPTDAATIHITRLLTDEAGNLVRDGEDAATRDEKYYLVRVDEVEEAEAEDGGGVDAT